MTPQQNIQDAIKRIEQALDADDAAAAYLACNAANIALRELEMTRMCLIDLTYEKIREIALDYGTKHGPGAGPNMDVMDALRNHICDKYLLAPRELLDEMGRVRFRSKVSGMWYNDPKAAGDVDCVEVNGVCFHQTNGPAPQASDLVTAGNRLSHYLSMNLQSEGEPCPDCKFDFGRGHAGACPEPLSREAINAWETAKLRAGVPIDGSTSIADELLKVREHVQRARSHQDAEDTTAVYLSLDEAEDLISRLYSQQVNTSAGCSICGDQHCTSDHK